ncbi:M15 family metallopeptidase [uncultured Legionella sp.]|uniref:M15 family metallopeptidase n=1 Tax=uncultured Legionella sp. TaxID=210934 RepID=UPI0026121BA9|nr:M15 family metallopeptidase [uncultured Legionella sp.]
MSNPMSFYPFSQADFEVVEFHNQLHPRIKVEPVYFNSGLSPRPDIYGRAIVLHSLFKALDNLPEHYGFLVWDVYRPRAVQAKVFNWMRDEIRKKMPSLSDEESFAETRKYASLPSPVGDEYCAPHLSGGAIDLTIINLLSGQVLEMGTPLDECSERAHLDYFDQMAELTVEEQDIRNNRHLLRLAMEQAGFTSYQYEWWHYDLGTVFWSSVMNQPTVFGPLFGDNEWPVNS